MINILSSATALDLNFLRQMPISTLFILGLSVAISLITTISNRIVIDLSEYRRQMMESSRIRRELMKAMKSGNKRQIDRMQRQQQEMMKNQQKMMSDRMKTMLFFFIPFILFWQVLRGFFGDTTVAYMPIDTPWIGTELLVSNWYFFCSISTSIVVSRILGLTFEIEPEEK
jgi:uncharacterized membrane protein (DUF106 family)